MKISILFFIGICNIAIVNAMEEYDDIIIQNKSHQRVNYCIEDSAGNCQKEKTIKPKTLNIISILRSRQTFHIDIESRGTFEGPSEHYEIQLVPRGNNGYKISLFERILLEKLASKNSKNEHNEFIFTDLELILTRHVGRNIRFIIDES